MLKNHEQGKNALKDRDLLKDVVEHKKIFFAASYSDYDSCINGGFKLVPNDDVISELEKDYVKMLKAGMLHGEAPSFIELMSSLRGLEKNINEKTDL